MIQAYVSGLRRPPSVCNVLFPSGSNYVRSITGEGKDMRIPHEYEDNYVVSSDGQRLGHGGPRSGDLRLIEGSLVSFS